MRKKPPNKLVSVRDSSATEFATKRFKVDDRNKTFSIFRPIANGGGSHNRAPANRSATLKTHRNGSRRRRVCKAVYAVEVKHADDPVQRPPLVARAREHQPRPRRKPEPMQRKPPGPLATPLTGKAPLDRVQSIIDG